MVDKKMTKKFSELLIDVRACQVCQEHLVHKVRPVLSVHSSAKILIIGQAPGKKVHDSGIPWDDQSGNRLREWMGIKKDVFYDTSKIAIVPMGFCYPGKGTAGDLPPRPECAPLWHKKVLNNMPDIEFTLLIGQHSQNYYLAKCKNSLTETIKSWEEYLPDYLPLPHPSPRNFILLNKNKWLEKEIIPYLQIRVKDLTN